MQGATLQLPKAPTWRSKEHGLGHRAAVPVHHVHGTVDGGQQAVAQRQRLAARLRHRGPAVELLGRAVVVRVVAYEGVERAG
jgi:hypothetical protein